MNDNGLPLITEFVDYRKYLRAVYDFWKNEKPRFSFQTYTDILGFGNRSFIQNILRGAKDFPPDALARVSAALGLDDKQRLYFELLIEFDTCVDPNQRDLLWRQIRARQHRNVAREIDESQFAALERWHTSAVKELLCYGVTNPKAISRLLQYPVSVADIRRDIKLLTDLGLVRKNDDGTYSDESPHLRVPPKEVLAGVIRGFQSQMIELGREALNRIPSKERNISTITLSLSADNLALVNKRIADLAAELEQLSNQKQDSPKVYNVNVALFPLTGEISASLEGAQEPDDGKN